MCYATQDLPRTEKTACRRSSMRGIVADKFELGAPGVCFEGGMLRLFLPRERAQRLCRRQAPTRWGQVSPAPCGATSVIAGARSCVLARQRSAPPV
jgi:hypothetical protein